MDRCLTTPICLAAALLVSLTLVDFTKAQCDSGGCDYGYTSQQPAGCVSGNCGAGFGYPGGSCASCGGNGPLRSHYKHLAEIHRRDFQRNQAWPKPFNCADRQAYAAIWDSMVRTGVRWNCVFTAQHFKPGTNELNAAGIGKIRGIYKNNPANQKMALVQNFGDKSVVQARLNTIRNTVNTWYGSGEFIEIAVADEFPGTFKADRIEVLNQLFVEGTPEPIIPVATGTGTTTNLNGGN